MSNKKTSLAFLRSLPSWECGLKSGCTDDCIMLNMSLPSWECGLKSLQIRCFIGLPSSLPSWECGLKFPNLLTILVGKSSLPSWECGLKSAHLTNRHKLDRVTPFVGVWIEIVESIGFDDKRNVTPFVGVWIEIHPVLPKGLMPSGHSLRGSVD